jgi:hypothetical protein
MSRLAIPLVWVPGAGGTGREGAPTREGKARDFRSRARYKALPNRKSEPAQLSPRARHGSNRPLSSVYARVAGLGLPKRPHF